jgi:hypothetical protein
MNIIFSISFAEAKPKPQYAGGGRVERFLGPGARGARHDELAYDNVIKELRSLFSSNETVSGPVGEAHSKMIAVCDELNSLKACSENVTAGTARFWPFFFFYFFFFLNTSSRPKVCGKT